MPNHQALDELLSDILNETIQKLKALIGVDRATIFLVNQENLELCLVLSSNSTSLKEIRIPTYTGIPGDLANLQKFVDHAFDSNYYTESHIREKQEPKYITYNLLSLPLLNRQKNIIAFVQFINKLKDNHNSDEPLNQQVDLEGFIQSDEEKFYRVSPAIYSTLQRCHSLYTEIKKQRVIVAFIKAIHAISQSGLDLEATLKLIADEAKELMNADRCQLWLIDADSRELWTNVFLEDGSLEEQRIPMGVGFVGKVAESGQPINIPFDLYDRLDVDFIQRLDQSTGYRTCSLLCTPIFNANNDLIGVIELINKLKLGNFPDYSPDDWPLPPKRFKASFNQAAQQLMSAFNVQVSLALQNAQCIELLKQQEQIQQQILDSLAHGMIYTDKNGLIILINETAKQLFQMSNYDQLKGQYIGEVIPEPSWSDWFQKILEGKNYQQSYPNQVLKIEDKEHPVDLLIKAIADVNKTNKIHGVLVIINSLMEEKQLKSMNRYISQQLADKLLNHKNSQLGTQKDVSVLFSDIREYTSLIQGMDREAAIAMFNEYFEVMVEAIFQHKGMLDKYIGDALMAVFGSPVPLEDHAWRAVQTATEMRHRLADLNVQRLAKKQQPIRIGICITSDEVISGNIGSSQHMEFTVMGEGVNLASHLGAISWQYGCDIIISETTYRVCRDRIWVRELDRIRVKDKNQPVSIYELVGLRSESLSPEKQNLIEHYQKGRQYYLERQFAAAVSEFAQVLAIDGSDKATALHIKRCLQGLESPPPTDWDGVMNNK